MTVARRGGAASARSAVDPFLAMDVMERARAAEAAGRSIVHMEVGQPATGAPRAAREALARAMEAGPLGYTVALGRPDLRARIARHYGDRHGLDLDPARIVVTAGASAGFLLAFTALFDAGARVALGLPGYPSYRAILRALSLEAVGIPTRAEDRFQPVPADVAGLDGLIVASPANPTGTVLSEAALRALVEACAASGTALVSDEIYHGVDYGARPTSALEITDDVTVVNSFSKYYAMTGWRIGWMVVPPDMVRVYERLAQNMFICAPHASQVAALAAMDATEELDATLAVYAANRALLLDGLAGVGLGRIAPPDGAFYAYADVSDHTDDSVGLAAAILDEEGVAVTPGLDFDPGRGGSFLRLSYACSTKDCHRALERLHRFARSRGWIG